VNLVLTIYSAEYSVLSVLVNNILQVNSQLSSIVQNPILYIVGLLLVSCSALFVIRIISSLIFSRRKSQSITKAISLTLLLSASIHLLDLYLFKLWPVTIGNFIWIWLIVINLIITPSYFCFDKYCSMKKSDKRIPETTLHSLSTLGGALGALVTQSVISHKTAKSKFQIVFWLTVIGNIGIYYLAYLALFY